MQTDLLEAVVLELQRRQGSLQLVARECGISYDTVLRVKNREGDPGYSKVLALHRHLFGAAPQPAAAPAATGEA